jgi:hypothetical protein
LFLGLAFPTRILSGYYVPSVNADYTIDKKLENATKAEVSLEEKTVVINAKESPPVTDQTGRGQSYNVQEAFNHPVMRVSQMTLKPTHAAVPQLPENGRKTKKLNKLKFK